MFRVWRAGGPPPFTYYCEGTPYGSVNGTQAAAAVTDCIARANANLGGIVHVGFGSYAGTYNVKLGTGVELTGQGILAPTGSGIALSGGNRVEGTSSARPNHPVATVNFGPIEFHAILRQHAGSASRLHPDNGARHLPGVPAK